MTIDAAMSETPGTGDGAKTVSDGGLHRKPELAPVFAVALFVLAVVFLVYGAKTYSPLFAVLLHVARFPRGLFGFSCLAPLAVLVVLVIEQPRRSATPPLARYLLVNRAVGCGVLLVLALHAHLIAGDTGGTAHLRLLLSDVETQTATVSLCGFFAAVLYAGFLSPLPQETATALEPYRDAVARLRDTYDFVLGAEYPEDWKRAVTGKREWLVWKEHSLWTNLFVFGGIDSGKTSALAKPLILQALSKYPKSLSLRPSLVLLDLKGDLALEVYGFCKQLGREREFLCIAPGNQMLDKEGKPIVDTGGSPIIPLERFVSINLLGGRAPADVRASLLLDGLASTNDGPKFSGSAEYFENVEAEFLSATVQLFDVVLGHGKGTLLDVYFFAYDEQRRKKIVAHSSAKGTIAQLYFQKRFARMKPEDQGHLISGLTAKLAKLTSPSVQRTFCPGSTALDGTKREGDARVAREFPGFTETVINHPGVVVFSVPEAIYSRSLCRVLGIMFMRAFHTEMLERSTSQFVATGGNNTRLVMNVVDESWAFMNRGVASFTAVSRQARACSVFLTQSLDQIPETYRATVEGNFRTKALLSVNDSLTLKRFEELLGTHKEVTKNVSTNASLSSVRHGVFLPGVIGKEQGISQTFSQNEQLRPRFSQHEIQHLPRGRAVVHVYTEEGQREAVAMETTPWFQSPYYLLPLASHPDVLCRDQQSAPREGARSPAAPEGAGKDARASASRGARARAHFHDFKAIELSNLLIAPVNARRATPATSGTTAGTSRSYRCARCGHVLSAEAHEALRKALGEKTCLPASSRRGAPR